MINDQLINNILLDILPDSKLKSQAIKHGTRLTHLKPLNSSESIQPQIIQSAYRKIIIAWQYLCQSKKTFSKIISSPLNSFRSIKNGKPQNRPKQMRTARKNDSTEQPLKFKESIILLYFYLGAKLKKIQLSLELTNKLFISIFGDLSTQLVKFFYFCFQKNIFQFEKFFYFLLSPYSLFHLQQQSNQEKFNQLKQFEILQYEQFKFIVFTFTGSINSPYEGFWFRIKFQLTESYPYRPPKVILLDKVWNPYVDWNTNQICIDILGKKWSPALTNKHVLLSIISLLGQTEIRSDHDGFINPQAAIQMIRNYNYFADYAKALCQKHSFKVKQVYEDNMRGHQEEHQALAYGKDLRDIIRMDLKSGDYDKKPQEQDPQDKIQEQRFEKLKQRMMQVMYLTKQYEMPINLQFEMLLNDSNNQQEQEQDQEKQCQEQKDEK